MCIAKLSIEDCNLSDKFLLLDKHSILKTLIIKRMRPPTSPEMIKFPTSLNYIEIIDCDFSQAPLDLRANTFRVDVVLKKVKLPSSSFEFGLPERTRSLVLEKVNFNSHHKLLLEKQCSLVRFVCDSVKLPTDSLHFSLPNSLEEEQ